jgi:ribosomal 30S subunit maturation factor RimM
MSAAMAHGGAGGLGAGSMGGPGFGAGAMGGPSQSGIEARANSMGPANASPTGIEHSSPNSVLNGSSIDSRINQHSIENRSTDLNRSTRTGDGDWDDQKQTQNQNGRGGELTNEAFLHASPNAIMHASPNSILARSALPSAMLPGLTTGLSVTSSTGASIGTISSVLTTRNGSIAGVVVTSPTGQTYRVPASALTVSGSTVTVNSAELGSAVPSSYLPGLATGLTVDTTGGTSLGTISQINTGRNGLIDSVTVTTASGQTYTLPASSLSISGNTVSVNTSEAFEGAAVPSSLLPGLTTGLTVNTSAGASLGTVSQINTAANGSINSVTVTSSTGQTYTLPASSLSVSGNTVSVNTSEAFESTGVPATVLPGLSTGLTVDTSTGASLGTVSRVMTDNGYVTGVVVTTATGQTYTVPATSLSISGNTVTVANAE